MQQVANEGVFGEAVQLVAVDLIAGGFQALLDLRQVFLRAAGVVQPQGVELAGDQFIVAGVLAAGRISNCLPSKPLCELHQQPQDHNKSDQPSPNQLQYCYKTFL